MSRWGKSYWADTAERVGSTTVAVLVPDVVAWQAGTLDLKNAATIVVATAALTLLKCLGANFKNPESGPSLLSPPPGPVEVDAPPEHRAEGGQVSIRTVVYVLAAAVLVILLFLLTPLNWGRG